MASQRGKGLGLWQLEAVKTAITSDATLVTSSDSLGLSGAPVMVNGYSMANCIIVFEDWLDCDSTVTPTFQVNATATSRDLANDSDFATIAAGTAATCEGTSDSNNIVGYSIDLVAAGISTGLLRTTMIASDSDSAAATVIWLMTRPSHKGPDTDSATWSEVAS